MKCLLAGIALVCLGPILVPLGIMVHNRPIRQVAVCRSNLVAIGTALEMYSTDNAGRYPDHLSALAPDYLRVLPTCPSTGTDTYAQGYQVHHGRQAHPSGFDDLDTYTVTCAGDNHAAAGDGPNFPRITSVGGLEER